MFTLRHESDNEFASKRPKKCKAKGYIHGYLLMMGLSLMPFFVSKQDKAKVVLDSATDF